MAKLKEISNYHEALETLGSKGRVKLGHNSYLEKIDSEGIGVRYHNTIVFLWTPDNKVKLYAGGWETVTTKDRINNYLPNGWYLSQSQFVWYLANNIQMKRLNDPVKFCIALKKGLDPEKEKDKYLQEFSEGITINLNTNQIEI